MKIPFSYSLRNLLTRRFTTFLTASGMALVVFVIALPKRGTNKPSNIVIRGIGEHSMTLRSQAKIVQGRMPRPGSSEIITGSSIAERFEGGGLGETLRFGMRDWTVGGVFDAGNTGPNP